VTKSYVTGPTRVFALRGVELEVRRGELMMLVGPSGCGKTTLISVIAGILDHDEGECLVFSQDLRAMGQTRKTATGGKYWVRLPGLQPSARLTARKMWPFPADSGKSHGEADSRRKIIWKSGAGDRINSYPAQLSGGSSRG